MYLMINVIHTDVLKCIEQIFSIKASNGFQASKITKIYGFFFIVVICLLTSLEHNPKISNPQVISKVV